MARFAGIRYRSLSTGFAVMTESISARQGFGGYCKTRLRCESAKKLSKKNVKFMLGLGRLLLGEEGGSMMSLDLLAMPKFITLIDGIFRRRKMRGQRKYQLFLEMQEVSGARI